MPSAVNMQLTYLLNPHSVPHCWLLLLKLSTERGYGLGGGLEGALHCYTVINKRSICSSSQRRGFVCALGDGSHGEPL